MKRIVLLPALASVLGVAAVLVGCFANAQSDRPARPARDGQQPAGRPPRDGDAQRQDRPDPLLQLFDLDGDRRLSVAEVDAIAGMLKQGDTNQDGYLDREELPRPPRPEDSTEEADMPRPPRPPRDQARPNDSHSIDTSRLEKGTVVFQRGYQTDSRDGGRPIVLIAAALGVPDQVFRDAFSQVRPARDGQPSPERVRENKAVLMAALGKHGITNDRLDEVSNYYRYRPQDGELWTHRPAKAEAVIVDNKVTEIKLLDAGAGYSSTPQIEVVGYPDAKVSAAVEYGTDLKTNGRVKSLTISP